MIKSLYFCCKIKLFYLMPIKMFSQSYSLFNTLFFSILFVSFLTPCISQEKNFTDEQGKKQGFWSKNFENGKTRYEGNFKDNLPTGLFKYWHENGNLKVEMNYFNENQCQVSLYNVDGKHIADGFYYNQVKDSLWRYFDDNTGNRVSEEFYRKDIPYKQWIVFYSDGKTPSEIYNYDKGKKEGLQTTFFENGQKKEQWTCQKSVITGDVTYYHPNGKVRCNGQYENDVPVGIWTYFDEDGKITVKDHYENGKVIQTEDFEEKTE